MDKDKIIKWSLIISIAVNLLFLWKITNTEEELQNINNSINYLQNNFYEINSNIGNLQYSIQEQSNFIANISNEVDPKDISMNGYIVKTAVSFKDLIEGEEPYIVYRNININNNYKEATSYSEWTTVKLEKVAPLSYEVSLALNYSNNYEYKFVTQGEQERSSELNYLSSNEYTPIRMEANEYFSSSDGKNSTTGLFINVFNQYNVEGFEVDKIVGKVIATGKEYIAEKVSPEDEDYGYGEKPGTFFDRYKIEILTKDAPNENAGYFPVSIELICKNGFKIVDDRQNLSYTN